MEIAPQQFDVCVVCALPEEISAFLEMLRPQCKGAIEEHTSSRYHYSYRAARITNNNGELLTMHISWLSRYGPSEMTLHLDRVLQEYQPRIAIMTGICAGNAQHVQLGDLVIAERTFTYDNGKFTLDEHGRTVHQHDTLTYQLDTNILQFLGLFDEWKPLVTRLKRPRFPSGQRQQRKVMRHIKPMASGSAVRADHPFEEIRTPVRGTVAIDMEGAGFGLVMSRHPSIPWLVVKGVCDYADQDKNDAYHYYAARASALYALSFLRAYMTNEHLPRLNGPSSSNQVEASRVWTVPYPRNPLFIGREAELQAIASSLQAEQNAAIAQAISGLGGIGKTQTALEYAYRHKSEYRYVFWAIAETHDTLNIAYSRFAELLDLPEKHLPEQRLVVEAVKRWFAVHENWLLILDNADDLTVVSDYLPSSVSGHLLLTTRAHAIGGLAQRIEIKRLEQEEGSRFLLNRANLLGKNDPREQADPGDLAIANEIVRELAGLPLALDQAGAYIEETSCGLQAYLDLYHVHHAELLRTRGGLGRDHPEPIATTLYLCFARVEQINPAAADLLRLCAFLAPDDIPELLLTRGSFKLTPLLLALSSSPLKLNTAIADLQKYSLIGRIPTKKTMDVHRLVQVTLRDAMTSDGERVWAERTVRVLDHVFPGPEEMKARETCQQLLSHGQACTALIEHWQMKLIEGAHLLHNVGWYLFERAEYQEAQQYYEQAVAMKREVFGEESLDTAASLNNLALVYDAQGKYDDALALYEHVLAMKRKALGEQHIGTATTLNNLAMAYRAQGKYDEALAMHQQELAITRKALGEQHPDTAKSWGNLANVYRAQGKYNEAQDACERALAIQRETLGEQHPDTATSLNNLALVYRHQGKYEGAAVLHTQALDIRREVLGKQHPDTAASLEGLALVYATQENYEEAEPLFQQALTLYRSRLGEDHPAVARCQYSLGLLYRAQKKYQEALPLFKKALVIYQEKLGPEHDATRGTQHSYEETVQLIEGKVEREKEGRSYRKSAMNE